jgi:hypothetical protein
MRYYCLIIIINSALNYGAVDLKRLFIFLSVGEENNNGI